MEVLYDNETSHISRPDTKVSIKRTTFKSINHTALYLKKTKPTAHFTTHTKALRDPSESYS